MLVNFGYFLSVGVMQPILPLFVNGPLHQSNVGVGISLAAFTVTALALRQPSGRLGDSRGRGFTICIGTVVNVASVLGLVFATSLVHVVILRMLTGIAEAFIFVGVATAVQDLAPDDRRGEAASLFSLSLFFALAIGPLIGEWLLTHSGFHAVWWFAAAAGAFAIVFAMTLPDTRPSGEEEHPKPPLIHPASLRPGAILGCAIWGLAAFQGYVPLYATLVLHMRNFSGVFLVNALVIMLVRSVGARLPDTLGHLRTARLSLLCTPIALAVMGSSRTVGALYAGSIILALGQSLAFPALMSIAVNNAPASERGAVMGTFTAFFDISFGGGALVLGAISGAIGYNKAFLSAGAVATIGLGAVVFAPPKVTMPSGPRRPVFEIEPPGE
jgi:MFS family permease